MSEKIKYQVATALAVLFHTIGITGILFFNRDFFVRTTSINLLLMFLLLIWTQPGKKNSFWLFLVICFFTGLTVEIIGINTGMLFGNYRYGTVLGISWKGVPLIIGINWFIIIYCCGISIHSLLMKILHRLSHNSVQETKTVKALSVIIDGATMAFLFDWLMEPVAVSLNYWKWLGNGSIPIYNYICWFLISVLLLLVFHFCNFEKRNKFAVNLLLIQVMFFLLLRTFMQ